MFCVIPRIRSIQALQEYRLQVVFDDGKECIYDVNDDIDTIEGYSDLRTVYGLFEQARLDESRTCVIWTDFIDLPSDTIYEYGKPNIPADVGTCIK